MEGIKFYELKGNKWTPTKGNTLRSNKRYIKLYELINNIMTFKGIGIYNKAIA